MLEVDVEVKDGLFKVRLSKHGHKLMHEWSVEGKVMLQDMLGQERRMELQDQGEGLVSDGNRSEGRVCGDREADWQGYGSLRKQKSQRGNLTIWSG